MISSVSRRCPSARKPTCVRAEIGQIEDTATIIPMADPARPMDSIFNGNLRGRRVAEPLLDPNGDLERPWVLQP